MKKAENPCGNIYIYPQFLINKVFENSCKNILAGKIACAQNLMEYG